MSRSKWQTPLGLALLVACLVGEALVFRVGIDDLDEGYFVQQAVRVLHGQVPYRDFETLYTPGLAYVHAALFGTFGGPFVLAPRALTLAARTALVLLLWVMARPLVRQPLWAAMPGVFLLVGLDDAPVRWEPHPGWLSTLFGIVAAWCLSHRPTRRWLVAAGTAVGVAYVFKQNTGAFILAAIVVAAAARPGDRLKRVGVPLVAFGVTTALWLVPLVVAIGGDITQLGVLVGAVNQNGLFAGPELPVLVPLGCVAGGLWLARRPETDQRQRWYLLAGSALFVTQYPRMDALHLAWSAPLLLLSGALTLDRCRPFVAVPILVGVFALAAPTIESRVFAIQQPRVAMYGVRYADGIEVPAATRTDLQAVLADIEARTQPNEPIFVYPTSPLLYALAERPNPTRFDHLNPGAADVREIDQVIRDLQASGVRLIVVSDFWEAAWGAPGSNAALEAWVAGRFTEVGRYGAYRVLLAGL